MAGHSKWANIKHKKAAADAVKGKVFSKLAKEIMVLARSGGGDPAMNITLRTVLLKARAANMPADNIERAIKKGTGDMEGVIIEEVIYEGYAPGGVAIIVKVLSDNRNRTASEIRFLFTKHGGNLASQGSVMRSFKRKGQIVIKAEGGVTEDQVLEATLEAGAEDVQRTDDLIEVLTEPADFPAVVEALAKAGIKTESAEVTMLPDLEIPVTDKDKAADLLKFIEALEDHDDVQNVYSNFSIDDALMEQLNKG